MPPALLTSLMDALWSAWQAMSWPRPDAGTGAGPTSMPTPGRRSSTSVLRDALHVVGLVLYTVVAVNALLVLELVPSLGPAGPRLAPRGRRRESIAGRGVATFAEGGPHDLLRRRAAPQPRSRPVRRRMRSRSVPAQPPRAPLPAGPARAPLNAPLLTRLPLELRQEIYRYVLAGRHKQFIRLGSDDAPHPADFHLGGAAYRTRDSFVAATTTTAVAAPWSVRRSAYPKGQLLALPLVCRQVYAESIALLYQAVVFKACRLVTLADLYAALAPPGHLAHIRELEVAYEFRCGLPLKRSVALVEDGDWETTWRVVARDMPGLRRLRVDLFAFDVLPLVQPDDDALSEADPARWRWLQCMLQPTHLKVAQLKLHYIKRLNDIPWERPTARPVRWYTLIVMEALERLIEASWMGKRLDPAVPPFAMPKEGGQTLLTLWETCCSLQRVMTLQCPDPEMAVAQNTQ